MMLNKFKTAFTLLALLTATTCFAQKKKTEAYIVTAANDTIQGILKQQKEKQRLHHIHFKRAGAATFSVYNAAQIKAYGIGDSVLYVAHELKEEEQPVFLKVLVEGPASLYSAEHLSSAGDFYVQRTGEQLVQLQRRNNLAELNYLLADCPELTEENRALQKNKYTSRHVSGTIHAYNACSHPDETSRLLFRPSKIQYLAGIRAGSHFGNINYTNYYSFFQKHFDNKVPLTPGLAGGIFLNISDSGSNLMLQAELLYKQYKSSHTIQETRYTRSFDFTADALQIPLLLQYKMPLLLKVQPYLSAGLGFSYLSDPVIVHDIRYEANSTRSSSTTTETPRNWSNGFMAGGGFFYKLSGRNRLLLDFQYSRTIFLTGFQVSTGITL